LVVLGVVVVVFSGGGRSALVVSSRGGDDSMTARRAHTVMFSNVEKGDRDYNGHVPTEPGPEARPGVVRAALAALTRHLDRYPALAGQAHTVVLGVRARSVRELLAWHATIGTCQALVVRAAVDGAGAVLQLDTRLAGLGEGQAVAVVVSTDISALVSVLGMRPGERRTISLSRLTAALEAHARRAAATPRRDPR
jgi:hypothetical protein